MDQMKELFDVYSYLDNKELDKQFPAPKEKTVRKFKANIEADEKHKNKSANDVKDLPGITLRERLLLELDYFKVTGNHLDIENWTLCTGSRDSEGVVPGVGWNRDDRKVYVSWFTPDGAFGSLRSRVAVLSSPLNSFSLVGKEAKVEIEGKKYRVKILEENN